MAAPHLGMPFGAVASVIAWHKFGAMHIWILRRLALVPVARYVDDFFGANRPGVTWTGGMLLSILCSLVGLICDPAKDVDDVLAMVVLGMTVEMSLDQARVLVYLEESKANLWRTMVEYVLHQMILPADEAGKLAGRLQCWWCTCRGKAGRAFLKALFAQQNSPMPGEAVSTRLSQALLYFLVYLKERPPAVYESLGEARRHIRTWSDASGVDRLVAAFILVDGAWFYTKDEISQDYLDKLLPRGDKYIGFMDYWQCSYHGARGLSSCGTDSEVPKLTT